MKTSFLIIALLSYSISCEAEMRTWTLSNGKTIEAEFVHVIGGKAVLRNPSGRLGKIELSELSSADRTFIELANPPQFDVSFRRKSEQKFYAPRFGSTLLPEIKINTFGARVRQTGAGKYNHELHIEFFAIGKERAGNRYILLDRHTSTFTPCNANRRSHEFWGHPVELDKYEIFYIDKPRGKKYAGHLILVTDERGMVIASRASHTWLFNHCDQLSQLPVGAYMDKACKRTFPTRPRPCRY